MTTYFLEPTRRGSWLQPENVVARLIREFDVVVVSKSEGLIQVDRRIAANKGLAKKPEVVDAIRRIGGPTLDEALEDLRSKRDHSFFVTVKDGAADDVRSLSALISPAEDVVFRFSTNEDEKPGRRLMKRFADAIGYRIRRGRA